MRELAPKGLKKAGMRYSRNLALGFYLTLSSHLVQELLELVRLHRRHRLLRLVQHEARLRPAAVVVALVLVVAVHRRGAPPLLLLLHLPLVVLKERDTGIG